MGTLAPDREFLASRRADQCHLTTPIGMTRHNGPHPDRVSHSETRDGVTTGCDAGMEPTTLAQLAETVAGFGALGVVTATLNLVALRVVRVDEVPGCVQARIRWWSAHNSTFLVVSVVVTVVGLALLAATAAR
jgi:hypothetical protein